MTGADIQDRLVLSCRGTRVCVSADISASKFPISAGTVIPKQEEIAHEGNHLSLHVASKVMVLVMKLPVDLHPCIQTDASPVC